MTPEDLEKLLSREIDPPEALVQKTMRRIRQETGAKSPRKGRAPWFFAFPTAALVFLAFGVGMWFGRQTGAPLDPSAMEIRFSLQAPGNHAVAISGDFTQWKPVPMTSLGSTGEWEVRLRIPAGGRYRYLFILDGKEMVPDPKAASRVDDGFGNVNSVLKI